MPDIDTTTLVKALGLALWIVLATAFVVEWWSTRRMWLLCMAIGFALVFVARLLVVPIRPESTPQEFHAHRAYIEISGICGLVGSSFLFLGGVVCIWSRFRTKA